MSPTSPSYLHLGECRGEPTRGHSQAGSRETDRESPPKHSSTPPSVRLSQWRFHLKPDICARGRSIITVTWCPLCCQHVADGQELSSHCGLSNTQNQQSASKVRGEGSRGVVPGFAAAPLQTSFTQVQLEEQSPSRSGPPAPTPDHHLARCLQQMSTGLCLSPVSGCSRSPCVVPKPGHPLDVQPPCWDRSTPAWPSCAPSQPLLRGVVLEAGVWCSDGFPHRPRSLNPICVHLRRTGSVLQN